MTTKSPNRKGQKFNTPIFSLGTAAIAVVIVVIGLWALRLGPPAAEPRPAERPAAEARPVEPPVAPPVEQPVAPPAQEAAAPPQPRPPVPPHIASFAPDADTVPVKEGARQSFSIALADTPPEGKPPVEWKLDGKVVASNVTRWDYQPDYAAATGSARHLDVLVGTGKDAGQSHAWNVNVEDVNRAPSVRPQQPSKIQAQTRDVDVKVAATDPDGDPLTYTWTIDGTPAGTNAAALSVNASTDHTVSLTVSDGKDKVTNNWQIAAVKPVAFALDFNPKQLDINTEFNKPKTFELVLPAKLSANGLQYRWTLNDKKVSDARAFVLKDYSASMVADAPLSVVATASNDQGQTFSHEWKVTVLPPAPEIARTTPSDRTLESEAGRPLAFELEARAPVGNQQLTYVYELDGKRGARGTDSRFEFTPRDAAAHEIVGYVEDNYRHTSAQKIKWTVRGRVVSGESDITDRVRQWLKDYEQASNTKDVTKLAELRGMNATMASQLEGTLKAQKDLRVKFSDFNIEKTGNNQARARYHRLDEWIGLDGKERSIPRDVEQTFQLDGSLLKETRGSSDGVGTNPVERSLPEHSALERYPSLECPDAEPVGEEFAVQVSLTEQLITPEVVVLEGGSPSVGGHDKVALPLPPLPEQELANGWDLDVILSAPGFHFRDGHNIGSVKLRPTGDSTPAVFYLSADAIASTTLVGHLYATFWYQGAFLAKATRPITIVAKVSSARKATEPRDAANQIPSRHTGNNSKSFDLGTVPPDLTVMVVGGGSPESQIIVISPHLAPISEVLRSPPELRNWLAAQYAKFATAATRGVGGTVPLDNQTARALLRGFGRELYRKFAPPAFKRAFWQLVDQHAGHFKTIQIITSDPLLPWELMRPVREDGSDEHDFLGVDFDIGRWHLSPADHQLDRPPQAMPVVNVLVIAPQYAGEMTLPGQQAELEALRSLPGFQRLGGNLQALRLLFANPPDALIHFAGHGLIKAGDDGMFEYMIRLEDSDVDLLAWRGLVAGQPRTHPFVFFNACDVGQANHVANFVDGWAPAMLDNGAAGYIGALWPLNDAGAARFSAGFYSRLERGLKAGGVSVAEVLREERRGFYETGDPSYLAYVYYGDPTFRFVPARP